MKSASTVALLLVSLVACSKDIHNAAAVRQGIIDHLAARKGLDLNMSAMEVEVTAVTFRQDEADATVSFRPKGGAASGMQIRYTLERKGNQWTVKNSAEVGAGQENPHGAGAPPPSGELPPGHPQVDPPTEPGPKQ